MIFGKHKKSVTNELTDEQKKMRYEAQREFCTRAIGVQLMERGIDLILLSKRLTDLTGSKYYDFNADRLKAILDAVESIKEVKGYINVLIDNSRPNVKCIEDK